MSTAFSAMGVDGCRGGWFYVVLSPTNAWSCGLLTSAGALLQMLPKPARILIDMPIGLRESGPGGRACDIAARRVLGRPRSSSVFPPPVRAALAAESYEQANRLQRASTGRGLSRQTWNIMSRMHELDTLVRQLPEARRLLREAHPEVCFWALNGGRAMRHNKKTPQGRAERRQVLHHHWPTASEILRGAASRYPRSRLGWDDIADALVLAVAGLKALRSLPEQPETDAVGLPMQIVYPDAQAEIEAQHSLQH